MEAADIIQKLYLVAQDLPADKFGAAKKKIESKYDEIERNLIEEFAVAQTEESIDKMKNLAKILSQFKGYNQCVDVYIEQSQAVSLLFFILYFHAYTVASYRPAIIEERMFLKVFFLYVDSTME